MSIVEKAVNREGQSNRPSKRVADYSSAVPHRDAASSALPPEDGIELSNLRERGLISVLEDSDLSRAFRFVKRAVLAKVFGRTRTGSDAGKVIMITSAMQGAGKSSIAFNLAVSIAQEQLTNVVLIDADTVRHKLSNVLGLRDSKGLIEILATQDMKNTMFSTDLPGLQFIPAGQARDNATELLASALMSEVLDELTRSDTVVVVDTTPLLVTSEADAMSAHVDHTIVIVESGNTSVDEIDSALQILKKSGSSVSLIMNKLKSFNHNGAPDHYYDRY